MAKRRASGDGMVRKRNGRWEGRIVIGHKENGDPIFRYVYADTQRELTAKLRQNISAYQGVHLTEKSNMTLSQWLDKWLDEYISANIRPNTLDGYRRDLNNHVKPYLGDKPLLKLTGKDLNTLYQKLLEHGRMDKRGNQGPGLSPTTVRGIHNTLHHALKTAVDEGLLPANPAHKVTPPQGGSSHQRDSKPPPAGCLQGGHPKRLDMARLLLHRTDHRSAAGRAVRPAMVRLRRSIRTLEGTPHHPSQKRRWRGGGRYQDLCGNQDHPAPLQHGSYAAGAKAVRPIPVDFSRPPPARTARLPLQSLSAIERAAPGGWITGHSIP